MKEIVKIYARNSGSQRPISSAIWSEILKKFRYPWNYPVPPGIGILPK